MSTIPLTTGNRLTLPQENSPSQPTLNFGDMTNGLYSDAVGQLKVASNGTLAATFNSSQAVTFAGAVTAATTLAVTGAATLSSTLAVTGATTLTAAVTPTGGVAAAGGFSALPRNVHTGDKPAASATDGTDTAIGATTEVNACECFVPCNMTVTGISVLNGPTVGTDKYCLILYDSAGAAVANTAVAGTTTSGADAYQRVAFTSAASVVGPATYHIAVTVDGTTDNHHTHAFGDFAAGTHTGHTFGTIAAITPDTTFTAGDGPIASLY